MKTRDILERKGYGAVTVSPWSSVQRAIRKAKKALPAG